MRKTILITFGLFSTAVFLTANLAASGDLDITWPHWAPGDTTEYLWIVFSSERDYGHEVTAANTAKMAVVSVTASLRPVLPPTPRPASRPARPPSPRTG